MKLSVVVPASDEAGDIGETLRSTAAALEAAGADFELVVVDDGSTDGTPAVVEALCDPRVRLLRRAPPHGFGRAVRAGIDAAAGDAVAVLMADGSDRPEDLVRYWELLSEGWPCVFGTRFRGGSRAEGYPRAKLLGNRAANAALRLLFRHGHDDTTNAFKAYSREVLADLAPLEATGFELTVELPLKAVVRGHRFATIDIGWRDRTAGTSKFRVGGAGRYALVAGRLLLERARRR